MLARIKKDDLVAIVSGKDKGKQGHVIEIDTKKEKVLIKGLGMVKRHVKARRQGEKSKISIEESYIPFCKIIPVCPSCKKQCRIQVRTLDDKKKARVCHRCKEAF
jgi:large subunit ribosomal protein L24